jgi:hypothetical protein
MNVLYYTDLDYSKVKKQFEKTVDFLQKGDFKSAEIKKLKPTKYYRARLDTENRLLFMFASYEGRTHILLLEVILNHEYEKSRFLRGADIDESKIKVLSSEKEVDKEDFLPLTYVNAKAIRFNLLDKAISFDESQELIFNKRPPVIIIGSAGSGKTALTLEKIKLLKGRILYITLSAYLIENSANLYYSFDYDNEKQEVEFLSFHDFIQSIQVAEGKEIDFKTFENWFVKFRNASKIKDSHKLFEEFKGVMTGMDIEKEYLSREDYEGLGVKQSVFLSNERPEVYTVFEKYLQFLKDNRLYDSNCIANQRLAQVKPIYDFIIVDEVQDFTTVQLHLILKSLKKSEHFILCGDSNQIVHPNFFSWSSVKTYLYKSDLKGKEINILKTNYRNAPAVTELANKLLKIKTSRFGAIDKESTYLVQSVSKKNGEVVFLQSSDKIKSELNQNTRGSAKYAVIVMRNEDKAEARKIFKTPLLFSIHEAKGLEYDNIILVNFITEYQKEFREICAGVQASDIVGDEEIKFSRGKDKTDKSLDSYKFYINSLYVAITRAVENLYLLEASPKHEMLQLLGLVETRQKVGIKEQKSSLEDWKQEAAKLEKQGKKEQADQIRESLLKIQDTPWKPVLKEYLPKLKAEALDPDNYNKKAKDLLFDYSLIYSDTESIQQLAELKYRRAENPEKETNSLYRKYYAPYKSDNIKALTINIDKYGINYRDQFNLTPLLAAVYAGSSKLVKFLQENGADLSVRDNQGKNDLQIALYKSYFSTSYAVNDLSQIYRHILTDSIKVKVDGRMIKIDNHKIEYFILNYLIALQSILIKNNNYGGGLKMDDFLDTMATYPNSVLPHYRKQRAYLNQAIARNEVDGKEGITKKLFFRVFRGYYVLNPKLEVLLGDDWVNVYEMMGTEKVGKFDQAAYYKKAQERYWEERRKYLEQFPEYRDRFR